MSQTATRWAASGANPWLPRMARVASVHEEAAGTVTSRLDVSSWPGGHPFQPGQFDMLYAVGVGEVPISISGDPGDAGSLVHTVREVGAVTRAIARAGAGTMLGVRGPFGVPWPLDLARGLDVVVVAGGLGLAPLRPALLHLLGHRPEYRRIAVVYGARSPADLLFRDSLAAWAARPDLDLRVTVDRADPGWTGHVGVAPALLRTASFEPRDAVALVCGPEIMMRFTVRELLRLGVHPQRLYLSVERNMRCALGFCGHCQLGPHFVCKDGPVFRYDRLAALLPVREA